MSLSRKLPTNKGLNYLTDTMSSGFIIDEIKQILDANKLLQEGNVEYTEYVLDRKLTPEEISKRVVLTLAPPTARSAVQPPKESIPINLGETRKLKNLTEKVKVKDLTLSDVVKEMKDMVATILPDISTSSQNKILADIYAVLKANGIDTGHELQSLSSEMRQGFIELALAHRMAQTPQGERSGRSKSVPKPPKTPKEKDLTKPEEVKTDEGIRYRCPLCKNNPILPVSWPAHLQTKEHLSRLLPAYEAPTESALTTPSTEKKTRDIEQSPSSEIKIALPSIAEREQGITSEILDTIVERNLVGDLAKEKVLSEETKNIPSLAQALEKAKERQSNIKRVRTKILAEGRKVGKQKLAEIRKVRMEKLRKQFEEEKRIADIEAKRLEDEAKRLVEERKLLMEESERKTRESGEESSETKQIETYAENTGKLIPYQDAIKLARVINEVIPKYIGEEDMKTTENRLKKKFNDPSATGYKDAEYASKIGYDIRNLKSGTKPENKLQPMTYARLGALKLLVKNYKKNNNTIPIDEIKQYWLNYIFNNDLEKVQTYNNKNVINTLFENSYDSLKEHSVEKKIYMRLKSFFGKSSSSERVYVGDVDINTISGTGVQSLAPRTLRVSKGAIRRTSKIKTKDNDMNSLMIVLGEIDLDNNNPRLMDIGRHLVSKLYSGGKITKRQATSILKKIK